MSSANYTDELHRDMEGSEPVHVRGLLRSAFLQDNHTHRHPKIKTTNVPNKYHKPSFCNTSC
ncbi:hypothetical protein TIFTF001_030056 [Ficus carica]|uniref:Uncharacterized protein n=1 Tax=Ficus carica TaxID=3494 RepID=A0AA88DT41_FICCA|nr:hypothetical protein TIFTF001_030056 [Ficus carica]